MNRCLFETLYIPDTFNSVGATLPYRFFRRFCMRLVLRIVPLVLLLALGLLVAPAAGQDLMSVAAENCDYVDEQTAV
jgi:hypothetical protein